jgi:hypothetical protein
MAIIFKKTQEETLQTASAGNNPHLFHRGLAWLPVFLLQGCVCLYAQSSLSGSIVDRSTGSPLPDAIVRVTPGYSGCMSDAKGMYDMALPAGEYILEVTYLGYEKKHSAGIEHIGTVLKHK